MHYAHCNDKQWAALDWQQRAAHVAHYRLQKIVNNHCEDAIADEMKREAKKAERKAKG